MEGRLTPALHLEMTDLSGADYRSAREPVWDGLPVHVFANQRRDRTDLPRTHPEFDTLAVIELSAAAPRPPEHPEVIGSHRFLRTRLR